MKNIEIELRSLIDENKFIELNRFLKENGKYLGEDNKDTHFFLFPDKLLKVTNNLSKQSAKITLKLNKIGKGSDFKEIEIPISQVDVDKTVEAFKYLGFTNNQYSYQFRNNYMYKDIGIAVKYTQSWGFHVEMDLVISEEDNKEETYKQISSVAKELGLTIMSDDELKKLTDKIDNGWNRGKYTKDTFKVKV
ncbi:hypothetical protein COY23_01390 [bacterium (Candidatus Torokbacteria) CG_4_10_14_0_2_um_filter_35_8]|nr:MAG: hypothetical protein COY23_01390 [bacterium (Candidatus Torokbacteria) CG_4_10_14_0_2_um_filter_35_8]